jgi:hypothetical protein
LWGFDLCCRYENELCAEELERKRKAIDDSTRELRMEMKNVADAKEGKNRAIKECTK